MARLFAAGPGDASSTQAYIAERDIAWVRFGIIAFNVSLYLAALPHAQPRHAVALGVCGVALTYATFVVTVRPFERFHILRTSTYTVLTDSALIAVWIYATGGLASPFYPLWAVSILAIVFRFGPMVVAVAASSYLSADLAMLLVSGDVVPGNGPVILARGGYILITGVLGTLLGHRWRSAVRERIRLAAEVRDQERLVAEAERIKALTDAAFEGICIHRDGVILEFNEAFGALFGKTRKELLGSHVRDLVDAASAAVMEERLANPADSGYELWIRHDDGRRRVAVQARAIEYKGRPARVAAVRDVTERFEAEQARALAHERQVEIDRLRAIDEFRTRFINTAAHELNTPLTPIKLQFAVIRDAWHGPPRAFDLLERNIDRLARLVEDMLDVARLERSSITIDARAIDLVPSLADIAETFEATALAREVHLEVLLPQRAMAFADPDRVAQVATNLVTNALKFTPKAGTVTLLAREAPGAVRVEITDTGAGIPADQAGHLFQPFGQVHDDPLVPGSGLGLYICKSLVEAMGGRIGVDSEGSGKGARFWFELPVRAPAGPGMEEPARMAAGHAAGPSDDQAGGSQAPAPS